MSTASKARTKVSLRAAKADDLMFINGIIETAVMSWELPERVKRLSLPNYRYAADHFDTLSLHLALEKETGDVLGVMACGAPAEEDVPADRTALLLHGIYVDPVNHREGIGKKLVAHAVKAARKADVEGVLVKAQPDALGFFESVGFERLPVTDPETDFRNRFWKAV